MIQAPPLRVLIVDDEAIVRRTLGRTLERFGYRVREAASGATALQALREEPADLLLTDLHMPDMDGVQLLIAARAMLPALRIFAMSGDPDAIAMLQQSGLGIGVVTLAKPFRMTELLDVLADAGPDRRSDPA